MSVSPLGPNATPYARPLAPEQAPARGHESGSPVLRGPASPARPAPAAAPAVAGGRALSADAPTGVDPELWSVLTSDERAHFAKLAQMGPLTYGRGAFSAAAPQPPAMRGARLDIRI